MDCATSSVEGNSARRGLIITHPTDIAFFGATARPRSQLPSRPIVPRHARSSVYLRPCSRVCVFPKNVLSFGCCTAPCILRFQYTESFCLTRCMSARTSHTSAQRGKNSPVPSFFVLFIGAMPLYPTTFSSRLSGAFPSLHAAFGRINCPTCCIPQGAD